MNEKNPTVALHVTSKELALIERVLGYNTAQGALRDKLSAAHKEMILANRQKNRLNKAERLTKKARIGILDSAAPTTAKEDHEG